MQINDLMTHIMLIPTELTLNRSYFEPKKIKSRS